MINKNYSKTTCSCVVLRAAKFDEDKVDEKLGLLVFTMHTSFEANIKFGSSFVWR